jgi:hypothetical protein
MCLKEGGATQSDNTNQVQVPWRRCPDKLMIYLMGHWSGITQLSKNEGTMHSIDKPSCGCTLPLPMCRAFPKESLLKAN